MYFIELTTESCNKVTIFFSDKLAVVGNKKGGTRVMDGLHNNGGWDVLETYDAVLGLISRALINGKSK